jgi:RNA polymerase sigma factor (sigma-70 family)
METIYRQHRPFVERVIRAKLTPRLQSFVDDLVQDVFLALHTCPQEFQSDQHLGFWLRNVARNLTNNFIKYKSTQKRDFRKEVLLEVVGQPEMKYGNPAGE